MYWKKDKGYWWLLFSQHTSMPIQPYCVFCGMDIHLLSNHIFGDYRQYLSSLLPIMLLNTGLRMQQLLSVLFYTYGDVLMISFLYLIRQAMTNKHLKMYHTFFFFLKTIIQQLLFTKRLLLLFMYKYFWSIIYVFNSIWKIEI